MERDGHHVRERKRHGRHYTPAELARFLAARAVAYLPERASLRVLDPACGDGELLFAVHGEIAARRPGAAIELVGYDLDPAALDIARGRGVALGIDVRWREANFLTECGELPDAGFDAVLANPPYVRAQQLGGSAAQELSRQFGLRGRIDLTHPFVAALPRLMCSGGVLGLLCANRFLTTIAGANLRAVLLNELTPVELYDLGDTRLFDAAVLPAITIATRTRMPICCRYVSVYQVIGDQIPASATNEACPSSAAGGLVLAGDLSAENRGRAGNRGSALFRALADAQDAVVEHRGRSFAVEVGLLDPECADAGSDPGAVRAVGRQNGRSVWRMSRDGQDAWLARVRDATWRTFGDVARIRVGIKTTADRVFIAEQWDEAGPEPELLHDLITHYDLQQWRIVRARATRVLYPYDTAQPCRVPIALERYPRAAAYLNAHRETLAARQYVIDAGREWYEIWVPQRPHLWRGPKIVFPDISERPKFALDRTGAVVNGDCYWIPLADLTAVAGRTAEDIAYLLMGVANSALGLRFYDAVCGNRLYAGRRRWITQYVSRLPLPDPATPTAAGIVACVRDLVDRAEPGADAVRRLDELVSAAFTLDR